MSGALPLILDEREMALTTHGVALLRAGTVRSLRSPEGARVTSVRER